MDDKEQNKELILNFLRFAREVYHTELREGLEFEWHSADEFEIVNHFVDGD